MKCYRCKPRSHDFERWYAEYIEGVAEGTICSACQEADNEMQTRLTEAMDGSDAATNSDALEPFEAMLTAMKQAGQYDGGGAVRYLARIFRRMPM